MHLIHSPIVFEPRDAPPAPARPVRARPAFRPARGLLPWLAPAVFAGAAARLWGLRGQIVLGDELHAVDSVVSWDLGTILTTYRVADHCIPLAAYDRLLVAAGLPLTELLLRLPLVLAGIAAIVLLPLAIATMVERRLAIVFGWLVALAPGLICYSRIARPYAVVVLLGLGAAGCFWRFWEAVREGRGWSGWAGWAVAYAVSGAAAAWFHPGAGPFVAAPLVYAGVDLMLSRVRPRRGWLALAGAAGLLGVLVAAFLLPAWESFRRILGMKGGSDWPDGAALLDLLQLQAGSVSVVVTWAFWVLVALGWTALWRGRRRVALFTANLLLWQGLALAVVRPYLTHIPVIMNRYLLIGLPVVLVWLAAGLVLLWRGGRGVPWMRWTLRGLTAAFVLGALAAHPHAVDPALRFGPFAGSIEAVSFERPPLRLPPAAVPDVYRVIAGEPGDRPVVEVASGTTNLRIRPEEAAWRVHGRPVLLATRKPSVADPRVAFRTLIPMRPDRIAATDARFAVLHLDRPRLGRMLRDLGLRGPGQPPERVLARSGPTPPDDPVVRQAAAAGRGLRRAWGEPHLTGPGVLAWDLDQIGDRTGDR